MQYRTGRLTGVQNRRINGLEAASGYIPVQVNGANFTAMLTAIRLDGKLYRLTGLVPRGSGLLPEVEQAMQSFRKLSAREARNLRPQTLDIVRVRRSDTVASLARRMNVDSFPRATLPRTERSGSVGPTPLGSAREDHPLSAA